MKFGGAAVSTVNQFERIAQIIFERKKDYKQIAVVVSAMGDTTDELIELARTVNPDLPRREYDMLVAVGERISASLLAMALLKKGVDAISFTGSQAGLITCDEHTEARIIDVRPFRILPHLEANKVIIVAGFQGVSLTGQITTLGRGGSDTSAVALGICLKADFVEFYKDVDGIYNEDPKKNRLANIYPKLNYKEALKIVSSTGSQVLHTRSIELAEKNRLKLRILSFNGSSHKGTLIADSFEKNHDQFIYEDNNG
ncbi:MAG: aspartate kinase [Parachlamydiales bacterium]|nr:aspartate kinase [Parachlamydiales bacterium]